MAASIRFSGIGITHRGRTVLEIPSLDVDSRPTLLLGPNGAGKTTLMSVAAGVVKPTSGDVSTHGRTVYVPQKFAPIVGFTCLEYCAYAGWLHGQGRTVAVREAGAQLDFVGLSSLKDAKCETLSGGEGARLAIATALNSGASTLLLDEPSASLDLHSKQQLTDIYRQIAGRGQHLVVSTHDAAELQDPFERVVVLMEGRIEFDGTRKGFAALGRSGDSPVAALSRSFTARGNRS